MARAPASRAVVVTALLAALGGRGAATQVAITGRPPEPAARSDLRTALIVRREEYKALLERYGSSHPLVRGSATTVRALEDSLVASGFTPSLLALRDTLAAAEWVAWLALRRQEAAPRSAWTAAQQRNRLRARYCTSAPPEPYCEMPSAQPIMPPASSRPRRHIAG